MEDIYQKPLDIRTSETDFTGCMRPGALLTAFQEAAEHHAMRLGCGFEVMMERKEAWVLTRLQMEVRRYPRMGEQVSLSTWPAASRRGLFPRYYTVTDAQGGMLAMASSLWVVLDLNTRRMTAPGEIADMMPDNSAITPPLALPGGVRRIEGEEAVSFKEPAYSDLDVNGHVNNTRYVDWLCDALGIQEQRTAALGSLLIGYSKEVRPGQRLCLRLNRHENQFSFLGEEEGKIHFECRGALIDRV